MRVICCLLSLVFLISGCQSTSRMEHLFHSDLVQKSVLTVADQIQEAAETNSVNVWADFSPSNANDNIITWAIWTDDDRGLSAVMSQQRIDAINERLQQLNSEKRLRVLLVTGDAGMDRNALEEIKNIADIISFQAQHVRFYTNEWEEMFTDLEKELKEENGILHDFYQQIDPIIWNANKVNNGYYSFSYHTKVVFPALTVPEETYKRCPELWNNLEGKELEEMESDLAVLSERLGYAPIEYFSYSGNTRDHYPYVIGVEEALTDFWTQGWEIHVPFVGCSYDPQLGEFVDSFHNNSFQAILERQEEWCQKGYMIAKHITKMYIEKEAAIIALYDHPYEIAENEWIYMEEGGAKTIIPLRKQGMILQCADPVFSCVLKKEENEKVLKTLNLLGMDEQISILLNVGLYYTEGDPRNRYEYNEYGFLARNTEEITDDVVQRDGKINLTMAAVKIWNTEGRGICQRCSHTGREKTYESICTAYHQAQLSDTVGFVFNPEPVMDELQHYLKRVKSFAQKTNDFRVMDMSKGTNDISYVFSWSEKEAWIHTLQEIAEEESINQIISEVNRQWEKTKEE